MIDMKHIKHMVAHNPLIPSIILKAFIIPTTQNIVKGMPNKPRLISPNPKRFPKLFRYISLTNIKPPTHTL